VSHLLLIPANSLILGLMATPESAALAPQTQTHAQVEKHWYSVWAVPPEDVRARLKKLMDGLRAEFGGPQYEPHMTVVKAVSLRPDDALDKFRSACQGLKPYIATVDHVATGFCVYLQIHPTAEVFSFSFFLAFVISFYHGAN
jgi:hypothetical protein